MQSYGLPCAITYGNVCGMNKATVIKITDALDPEEVCARLDVKPRSLRLARERGVFPASWYLPLREICEARNIECPESVFNWKSPLPASTTEAGK